MEAVRDSFLHQRIDFFTVTFSKWAAAKFTRTNFHKRRVIKDLNKYCPLGKCDHISIVFTIECNLKALCPSEPVQNVYMYNRGDYTKMYENMERIDWNEELKDKDVNKMWESFKPIVHGHMSDCIPKKTNRSKRKAFKPLRMNRNTIKSVKKIPLSELSTF